MRGRALLVGWFGLVLVAMAAVTLWASLDTDVLTGSGRVWREPWGRATIFDAYFAFVAVWLWIAWRERSTVARVAWLVAIFLLGNFAIAAYFLLQLRRAAGPGEALDHLFGRKADSIPGAAP
jgi:hypothetical protein